MKKAGQPNLLDRSSCLSFFLIVLTLLCAQSRHNMSAPDWVTSDVMERLKNLKDYGFQVKLAVSSQSLVFRVSFDVH